ncbi:MAG: oligosaccharide flippase family protein [Candidatus Aminicenantes bacterium]|nr:oligosaccharide flippase family protein [Candidatus Aminicenantes bacterium]
METAIAFSDSHFTRQVGTTLITQMAGLCLTVITTAVIARWLGPEGKGIIELALLLPGMLSLFLSGGIGVANVYFAGTRRLGVPFLTENSVTFAIISAILGGLVVGVLIASGWLPVLVPGINIWLILLAMVGVPFRLLSGYLSGILLGLQRIITVNLINLVQSVLTLVFTILLVIGLGVGLSGAILSSLGAGMAGLIILIIILRRAGGVFKPHRNPSAMHSIFSFGLKGHIGNVLQFFNYRLDMFFVNYFVGSGSVGIYSVSVGLAEILWYFPNAVGFVIFPKATATKPEVMRIFTPKVFLITLGVTALGAIGLMVLGKTFIQLIYSFAFIDAYIPMLVLLPGVILLGGAKVLTNEIAGRGYPQYNSINAGIALILTVIFDLILIPRFGILGAALASSISYTVGFFASVGFYLFVSRRIREFDLETHKQEIK